MKMYYQDKVDTSDLAGNAAEYQIMPSGSLHTTCKSFFKTAERRSGIEAVTDYCFHCSRKSKLFVSKAMCLKTTEKITRQYFDLVPKLHNNCYSRFSKTDLQGKCLDIAYNAPYILLSCLPKRKLFNSLSRGTTKTLLCLTFLVFAISSLCVEGAPTSRRSNKDENLSLNSNISTNLTSTTDDVQSTDLSLSHTKNIDILSKNADFLSIKRKRSTDGKRRRKGSKRNRKRKDRKGRKGRKGRKNRKSKNSKKVSSVETYLHEVLEGNGQKPTKVSNSPRRQRLYNKIGVSYHLSVPRKGKVDGEESSLKSNYSILEIRAVSEGGVVTIMGLAAQKYICVSKRGVVRAKKKYRKKLCRFKEKILPNHQNTYESVSCKGCFLNINRAGKVKRLKKINPKLPLAHFLPFPVEDSVESPPHKYLAATGRKIVKMTFPVSNATTNEFDVENSLSENMPVDFVPPISQIEASIDVDILKKQTKERRDRLKSKKRRKTGKHLKHKNTSNSSDAESLSNSHGSSNKKSKDR